jgi:hypothetical protein
MAVKRLYGGRRKVSDGFAEESGGGGQCCMCELERIV